MNKTMTMAMADGGWAVNLVGEWPILPYVGTALLPI